MRTTVTIIIPTYRPNSILLRTLDLISDISTEGRYSIEVLIINTVSPVRIENLIENHRRSLDLKITNIQKDQFNHGSTRNLGVRKAKGKYLIFLSQDACPTDKNFIDYFIEDLENIKTVAVFGKETAPKDTPDNFRRYEHSMWFRQYEPYYDEKGRAWFSREIKKRSPNPGEAFFWYSLSNVFSCYKSGFLKKHPFETIYYGEDVLMGKYIIEHGFKKVFDSRCRVEHFHSGIKGYIERSVSDWYFRIFVLKIPLRIKLKEKIDSNTGENLRVWEIYAYYFLKAAILAIVLAIRLKHSLLTLLDPELKSEYVKRHL